MTTARTGVARRVATARWPMRALRRVDNPEIRRTSGHDLLSLSAHLGHSRLHSSVSLSAPSPRAGAACTGASAVATWADRRYLLVRSSWTWSLLDSRQPPNALCRSHLLEDALVLCTKLPAERGALVNSSAFDSALVGRAWP